jgi:hypothetical protein
MMAMPLIIWKEMIRKLQPLQKLFPINSPIGLRFNKTTMANNVYIVERKRNNYLDKCRELLVYSNRDSLLKAMKNMLENDKMNNPYMNNIVDLIDNEFYYSIGNLSDSIIVSAFEREIDSKFI